MGLGRGGARATGEDQSRGGVGPHGSGEGRTPPMNRARTKIVGSTGQMRRPLALLLLALGLLTITACGGSATSTPASGAGGAATTAPTAAATRAATTAAATSATGG